MSLLAWYPLIKDNKNQGLDGIDLTTVGSVTYTDGKIGKAATFPGASGTRFRRACFPARTAWSCAAWVRCNAATSASQWAFNNGRDSNNDGWHCYFNAAGTTMYLRIGSSTWSQASTLGTWYHIAMTIDSDSKYTFYVNGEQKSTGTVATLPDYTECNNTMAIGGFYYNGGDIYPLNGQVQDFRYYDHVLSKREVKELSKGLMTHLPLSWGANPNMIKNSYTWMNKSLGSNNVLTPTKSVIEDNYAPCNWVFKAVLTNSTDSAKGNAGVYYPIGTQGLTTADMISGETYTYSFWAKADAANTANISLSAGAICESQTHVSNTGFGTLDTNWRKHTVTFKWTSTGKLTACFYLSIPANSTQTIYLCGFKLEKGSIATPYIPHVEEAAYTSYGYATMFTDECSGYNRAVTTTGTLAIGTDSPRGTGTYMTSGCYVQTSNGFPINSTIPIWTITMWFKPDIGQTFTRYSDPWRFWINTEAGNNTIFRLEAENTAATRYQMFYQNSGQSAYGGTVITNITEKTWYHIAFTFDGTNIYQYVNGSEVSHFTINSGFKPTGTTGYFQVGDSGMYASFADVRIYATALSADDIKALYNIGAEIDNTGKLYCNQLVEV